MKPTELDIRTRREVVRYLAMEGASAPEIAKILNTSDRTIRRHFVAIRRGNALRFNSEFLLEMAGELVANLHATLQRFRRISRDKATPAAARIEAEKAIIEVLDRCIARLQSLGLLPKMGFQPRVAGLDHASSLPSLEELTQQVDRIAAVASSECPGLTPFVDPMREAVSVVRAMSIPPGVPPECTPASPLPNTSSVSTGGGE